MLKHLVTKSHAISLASDLFNLSVDSSSVKELDSYDDRNFYVRGTKEEGVEREFVLKVSNPEDFGNRGLLEELNAAMVLLDKHGIRCSVPQPTITGKLLEMKQFVETPGSRPVKQARKESTQTVYNCAVRLFSFIPGKTMRDIPCSTDLCFKVGCFAAEVDKILKDLKCPVLQARYYGWDLYNFQEATAVSSAVKDPHYKKLLCNIEKLFKTNVQPRLNVLPKQCIHGDINEANLIVQNIPGCTKYEICGLIDFGDTNHTCRVFEVSIAAAYMMTMYLDDPLDAGVYTVAGYQAKNPLTQEESDLIFYLIQARLYQSICFGTTSSQLHKENSEYLLYSVKRAWKVLDKLAATSKEEFDEKWKSVSETKLNHLHGIGTDNR